MDGHRIEPVVTTVELPPGVLGPTAVTFDVRCFLVVGSNGVVLVDASTPEGVTGIEAALGRVDAAWSDVTDIVLTHRHFDHTGGLAEAADRAPRARVWAGVDDATEIARGSDRQVLPVADGQRIGALRVLGTPGHTPGHISLLHEEASSMFIGDLVGIADGRPTFGPAAFTADAAENARSLGRVLGLNPHRVLFAHGPELPNAADVIRLLLEAPPASSDIPQR